MKKLTVKPENHPSREAGNTRGRKWHEMKRVVASGLSNFKEQLQFYDNMRLFLKVKTQDSVQLLNLPYLLLRHDSEKSSDSWEN